MEKRPYWEQPTWRAALSDTNRAAHTVRVWMAEAVLVAIAAVVAVPFYPENATALEQAGISSIAVLSAVVGMVILISLANWVALSARNQRDDATHEIERTRERQDWRSLINDIAELIREGNGAMEAYGRPSLVDSRQGLAFMNSWLPRVNARLPEEYRPDFALDPRRIFEGDAVWVRQLDERQMRLLEIAREIRNRYL